MISAHEAEVASRFDALHGRFKPEVASDDYRLRAVVEVVGPLRGLQILDLGCGKGRFARLFQTEGASVSGIDLSAAMLAEARGIERVRASARRLPFRPCAFDAAIAIEVFEQMRVGRHTLGLDREVLFEDRADAFKNLCVGHGLFPLLCGFVRSMRRFALALDERGKRADRAEVFARAFVVRCDGQLVLFAQHDADFERIDRVETDAIGIEQRRIVVDIGRAQVFEIEGFDQKLFNFQF